MSSVATVMLVDMVVEAGGLELAVLAGGTVLGVLLGGVARLGWCRMSTGYRAPLPLESIQRPSEFHPGYPYRGTRIGRILLEGLLQIVLEHSVGAIILVRVMEVGEHLFEFAEEQRLRIGQGRDELLANCLRVSAMLFWSFSLTCTRCTTCRKCLRGSQVPQEDSTP